MSTDLSRFAAALGDPSAFFCHADGPRVLVVRESTGRAEYVVDGDALRPFTGWAMAGSVENPPGFAGFPEHDRDSPDHDLTRHGLDPAECFLHFEAEHPLVVRHADGRPTHRIESGALVPL